MEHGHLAHYPKLYDELVHVPLIVDVPGVEGGTVRDHVGLDAVPPTVCELLGVSPADRWVGESLLPPMVDGTSPPADPVVSVTVLGDEVTQQPIPRSLEEGELLVSARDDDWTYIEHTESGAVELYHRPTDPDQRVDRSDEPDAASVAAVDRLQGPARDHARALAVADAARERRPVADDDVSRRLEALGYR